MGGGDGKGREEDGSCLPWNRKEIVYERKLL